MNTATTSTTKRSFWTVARERMEAERAAKTTILVPVSIPVVPEVRPTIVFKSERAAKIAYTKAEKAYMSLPSGTSAYREAMRRDDIADPMAYSREAERVRDEAFEKMRNIYELARAQKFYVYSWYFSANATRDLIAANID